MASMSSEPADCVHAVRQDQGEREHAEADDDGGQNQGLRHGIGELTPRRPRASSMIGGLPARHARPR